MRASPVPVPVSDELLLCAQADINTAEAFEHLVFAVCASPVPVPVSH